MIKSLREKLLEIAETIDNALFVAQWPTSAMIPDSIHKKGLIGTLEEVKKELEKLAE